MREGEAVRHELLRERARAGRVLLALLANLCGRECPPNAEKKGLKGLTKNYDEDDGFPETAPVGSFPKGDDVWGVHDLSGNVQEWTSSTFRPEKPIAVYRGGGWGRYGGANAAWTRGGLPPVGRYDAIGFRCATSAP